MAKAKKADGLEEVAGNATGYEVNRNGGLQRVEVSLLGTSPLLMNAMPRDVLLSMYTREKAARTAERPDPRDLCETKLHKLANGNPCVPQLMLFSSFIAAGQFVRLDGKRQVSTASSTTLPGLMSLVTYEIPIVTPGTDDPAPWEVDVQQGRNPNGGEAVCVIRPIFYKWQLSFEILVDRKTFSLEQARSLIELSGRRCGLGDFRPNRKGTFGQSAVALWKPLSD